MTEKRSAAGQSPTRKLRVVINGIHAKSGGGVTYLRQILPEFAKRDDLEVHLFMHRDQFDIFYPVPDGINVVLFNYRPAFLTTLIWEQFSLPLISASMGADVVFSPANYGPVFARNHVLLLRNAVSVIRLTNRIKPTLYWLSLSAATLVSLLGARKSIAVSKYAGRILTFGMNNAFARKLSVVYHGTMALPPRPQQSDVDDNTILAVSDIYIQKNYHNLLRAFRLVREKRPNMVLKIVGREIDRHYADEVRALAADLGIEDSVHFLGHLETKAVIDLYLSCLVFVFPSTVETFGNPLLEAMAAAAPIACSNTAAMPEVVEDAGLLFNPLDPDDIAEKILCLIDDPKLREELAARGLERSRQFRWKETARQTVAVLKSAAGPLSTPPRPVR